MSIEDILDLYKNGDLNLNEALQNLSNKGIDEMGFATIDTDRLRRTGMPEVIYGAGKTTEQVALIAERMHKNGIDVLVTRATIEMYEAIKAFLPEAHFNGMAKTITYKII